MLRVWGRLSSINVRKVVLCAQVLGVPFERIDAGLSYGVVNTPDYRAKNPNGLVPLLEDGDFTLWESNAIVRYLCAREGSPLYPKDLQRRADAERWMDWQQTTLNPAGSPGFKQLIRTPEAQRDPAVIAASVAATEPLFTATDAEGVLSRVWAIRDTANMYWSWADRAALALAASLSYFLGRWADWAPKNAA